ncbi:MAG: aromatic ring-hydroxylating dioxygenase subunit alpha [Pseudomonadota bacterium]
MNLKVTTSQTLNPAYQKLLDSDSRPVPESYRRDSPIEPGPTLVSVKHYISREVHELEREKLWKRVWQMACHEDDLPNVGDHVPYDIAGLSFLIVRVSDTEIKAYYNACLHRGRKLREHRGKGAADLRCPFHGWNWHLDGKLKQIPCEWDFPGLKKEEQSLPEAQVGVWGRFVFINPDPDCESFEDFIGDLSSHFEILPYEGRYKEAHVAKVIRCNWKVANEAFMESYHVIATHPQILIGGVNDVDTKYDVFGNYSRAIRCGALESEGLPNWGALPDDGVMRLRHPLNGWVYERVEQGLVKVTTPDGKSGMFTDQAKYVSGELGDVNPHLCDWVGGLQLPPTKLDDAVKKLSSDTDEEGVQQAPRMVAANMQRAVLKKSIPAIADKIPDIEFASVFFTLFPNFHPWGSFNRIVYRFRPHGDKHDECIMECMYLAPIPEDGDYQSASEIHWLGPDDDWTEAPELGMLAKVFNQDIRNLPYVQQGLMTTAKEYVQLADYNETKPRHFHMLLEEWLDKD